MLCYVQLIVASAGKGATGEVLVGLISGDGGSYALLAVAAAMFLLLSFAGADLYASAVLLSERRDGPGIRRNRLFFKGRRSRRSYWAWVQRKLFGVCLLGSFVLLVVASTSVLLYSSFDDVGVVIGAAAVLFVADVDEKSMLVLKNIDHEWRVFWVFEAIGLGFGLAIFAQKAVAEPQEETRDGDCGMHNYCSLFDWGFVADVQPLIVTWFSLLFNILVTRPSTFLPRSVCDKISTKNVFFVICVLLWALWPFLLVVWIFHIRIWVDFFVVKTTHHVLEVAAVASLAVFHVMVSTIFAVVCRHVPSTASSAASVQVTALRTLWRLWRGSTAAQIFFVVGVPLTLHGLAFPEILGQQVTMALKACLDFAHDAWLLWGTGIGDAMACRQDLSASPASPARTIPARRPPASANAIPAPSAPRRRCTSRRLMGDAVITVESPPTTALLLGWGLEAVMMIFQTYWTWESEEPEWLADLVHLVWIIVLGLLVREATPKSVVFWIVATSVRVKTFDVVAWWMCAMFGEKP